MTPNSIHDIIKKISTFLDSPQQKAHLWEWQQLGGHLNWVLNVLPWGWPALSELYRKTSGKIGNPFIFINATICSNLSWLASTIPQSIGIQFIDLGLWGDQDAEMRIYTDASHNQGLAVTF